MAASLDDGTLVQAPLNGAPPLALAAALLARAEGLPLETVLDASLLDLRRRLLVARCARLGPRLTALSQCPGCEETIEVTLEADAVLAAMTAAPTMVTVSLAGDASATAAAPSVRDVLDAARADPDTSAELLRSRVCEPALSGGDAERVDAALEAADPLGGGVELRCPECESEWAADLDPCAYTIAELADDQRAVLDDVHALATAYGWDEAAVTALPAWRRARYRELIEQ